MAKNNVNPISDEMLDQILGEAKTQEDLFGSDGIIKTLSKRLMERLLQEEMTEHLGYSKHAPEGRNSGNSRNGTASLRAVFIRLMDKMLKNKGFSNIIGHSFTNTSHTNATLLSNNKFLIN